MHRNRGAVIIESMLVLPFIILVAIGGMEFTRSLRTMKLSITLSREIANVVFRECADAVTIRKRRCLETIQADMDAFSEPIAKPSALTLSGDDVVLIVAVFIDGAANDPVGIQGGHAGTGFGAQQYKTSSDLPTDPPNLLSDQGLIVTGEAYVRHKPMIGAIAALFGFTYTAGGGGYFYDRTII